ncbi:PLAT/LH2 domain-containing protein [Streptomyces sp. QH1-20]|uniref:PLAT/LH2 domain-containing protein n=1 Tax=Streptomyces sp. QH1-20 TaxID=3240934 RepID=UPI00351807B3
MSDKRTYSITIKTANVANAGTDANVKIQLIGEKGKSPEIPLDKPGKDDFEQGDLAVYEVTIDDIGNLKKARLFHDNSGARAGWCMRALDIRWSENQQVQNWWPTLGQVHGDDDWRYSVTPDSFSGLWLASDEGGIDKTVNLVTSGVRKVIIPFF